ncbi:FANCM protein, partial [Serilophus lunatus]|nr:FANCM protein [Serilophus lunatus]
MRGVYLESVRSPALGTSYKMVHRGFNSSDIFSQIPEQDSAYAEDSFCVGDEAEEPCRQSECSEEEEEECVDLDLLPGDSPGSGRSRYLTRRRRKLAQGQGRKPSRIIVISDSSEEETALGTDPARAEPSGPSAQHRDVAGAGPAPRPGGDNRQVLLSSEVSDVLDLHPELPGRSKSFPPAAPGSDCRKVDLQAPSEVSIPSKLGLHSQPTLCERIPSSWKQSRGSSSGPAGPAPSPCVLADSREICSGAEVISSLRAVHGLRVQVCPLGSSDYIVSSRLAVERSLLSELQGPGSSNKLRERLQRLRGLFERLCVIVETDRHRAGETSRLFQRTQHYDRVLSALVQAGIRLLFSSCQEETAALLRDLALLEQRKGFAIRVPTEVEGPRRNLLSFYLSIPNLSYVAALSLCHSFSSPRALVNSSPQAVAAGAQLSRPRAEEILRFLRHTFDPQLLPQPCRAPGRS